MKRAGPLTVNALNALVLEELGRIKVSAIMALPTERSHPDEAPTHHVGVLTLGKGHLLTFIRLDDAYQVRGIGYSDHEAPHRPPTLTRIERTRSTFLAKHPELQMWIATDLDALARFVEESKKKWGAEEIYDSVYSLSLKHLLTGRVSAILFT